MARGRVWTAPTWHCEGPAEVSGPCDDCDGRAEPGWRLVQHKNYRWQSGVHKRYVCDACLARLGLRPPYR
jgi:hypothetical protein